MKPKFFIEIIEDGAVFKDSFEIKKFPPTAKCVRVVFTELSNGYKYRVEWKKELHHKWRKFRGIRKLKYEQA